MPSTLTQTITLTTFRAPQQELQMSQDVRAWRETCLRALDELLVDTGRGLAYGRVTLPDASQLTLALDWLREQSDAWWASRMALGKRAEDLIEEALAAV